MTTAMPAAARAAIRGLPADRAQQVLALGITAGHWGWEALEAFSSSRATPVPEPRPRLPAKTRLARWDERPAAPCGRFIMKRSLDPTLDWGISDGAARCLDLILSLAGKDLSLVTFTSSLARQLGRTSRTVQNYYRALVEAGYLLHEFDRDSGRVTLTLTEAVRVPAYKPQTHERLHDVARRSRSPKLRSKLREVYAMARGEEGGAKIGSHINSTTNSKEASRRIETRNEPTVLSSEHDDDGIRVKSRPLPVSTIWVNRRRVSTPPPRIVPIFPTKGVAIRLA